jgi:hypothetical protein
MEMSGETYKNEAIVQALRNSWLYLSKYIKNMEPEWTDYFNRRLMSISPIDLLVTQDMLRDSERYYRRMVNERTVKSYMNHYTAMMQALLTYNKPFEESCDICQGALFYFTDTSSIPLVFKECATCGSCYHPLTDEVVTINKSLHIRPSTRIELESAGVINFIQL